MSVVAILSIDNNFGIGYQNSLLVHNKMDMKWFQHVTKKYVNCVVGSITASTLPTLKDRKLFVVSRQYDLILPESYCVIGGSQIYNLFQKNIDCWYITQFKTNVENVDSYLSEETIRTITRLYSKVLEDNDTFRVTAYSKSPEFEVISDFNFT